MSVENNENTYTKEQYLKLLADFENFKRQKTKEMDNFRKTANKDLLIEIIGVLDNVITAFNNSKDPEGFKIVYHTLMKVLEKHGVEKFGEENDVFDCELHDAITMSTEGKVESKHISKVLRYGYKLNNVIIRHAEVVVEK